MKRTKIICTMGPNTNDKNIMMELAKNGMDVARFNFSHGDYDEHLGRLELLKEVRKELDIPVAALLGYPGSRSSGHQGTGDSHRTFKGWEEGGLEGGPDLHADHGGDRGR